MKSAPADNQEANGGAGGKLTLWKRNSPAKVPSEPFPEGRLAVEGLVQLWCLSGSLHIGGGTVQHPEGIIDIK